MDADLHSVAMMLLLKLAVVVIAFLVGVSCGVLLERDLPSYPMRSR